MTAGGTDAALLQRIEAYFDAAPRPAAEVEEHGPFTLFVSRIPWRFYGRPRRGLSGPVDADAVLALRARQRELGVREALEWVAETTPSLAEAAAAAGMRVTQVPLLAARADALRPVVPVPDSAVLRMLGADDQALPASQDVVDVAFGGVGGAGSDVGFIRERIRRGITGVGVAEAGLRGGAVLGAGSHHPVGEVSELTGIGVLPEARGRGIGAALTALLAADASAAGATLLVLSAADDAVARMYERVGFARVGTACFGRAAGP
ncbi:MAG TPA: GNAT family N-acetyltransferase, partial [Solirubrobacteraceae bacterium]|nr:GNAT family N-acetyltransferase [Solirubrobacteraceae bacterium]